MTASEINSFGVINGNDGSVVIDADDIRQNYVAIQQIKKQLSGLANKSLEWSDSMGTYVIITYAVDENGDIIYDTQTDENGTETLIPRVKSVEPIGAVGTADPTKVVEDRTFSSLYAKTVYEGEETVTAPGTEQNGTLVDVLNNGWTIDQINGQSYYAVNDTAGTENSEREKGEPVDISSRTSGINTSDYLYTGDSPSFSASLMQTLNKENTELFLAADSQFTLPAGFYSDSVTILNGVRDVQKNDDKAIVSEYTAGDNNSSGIGELSLQSNLSDISIGLKESVTFPAGYYSDPITVNNGVKDRGSYTADNITGTFKPGYYSSNSIPNNGALNWSPSSGTTKTVAAGYYSGGTLDSRPAYNNGYSAGDSAGYTRGYSKGKSDGYDTGYSAGYSKGKADGSSESSSGSGSGGSGSSGGGSSSDTSEYDRGYEEGYQKGLTDGRNESSSSSGEIFLNYGLTTSSGGSDKSAPVEFTVTAPGKGWIQVRYSGRNQGGKCRITLENKSRTVPGDIYPYSGSLTTAYHMAVAGTATGGTEGAAVYFNGRQTSKIPVYSGDSVYIRVAGGGGGSATSSNYLVNSAIATFIPDSSVTIEVDNSLGGGTISGGGSISGG